MHASVNGRNMYYEVRGPDTVSRHNEWFKTSGRSTELLDEAFETDRRVIGAPGATHLRYRVVKR